MLTIVNSDHWYRFREKNHLALQKCWIPPPNSRHFVHYLACLQMTWISSLAHSGLLLNRFLFSLSIVQRENKPHTQRSEIALISLMVSEIWAVNIKCHWFGEAELYLGRGSAGFTRIWPWMAQTDKCTVPTNYTHLNQLPQRREMSAPSSSYNTRNFFKKTGHNIMDGEFNY